MLSDRILRKLLFSSLLVVMVGLFACSGGGSSSNGATGSTPPSDYNNTQYSIAITPTNAIVSRNATLQFTASLTQNGSIKNITTMGTWHSSNTGIATIDRSGKATGLSDGVATITVTYNNQRGQIQLLVTSATNGEKCIADLSQWKMRYTTSSLSCIQCHTTTQPGHSGTEGAPWRNTNCLSCHAGPHGSVSDD